MRGNGTAGGDSVTNTRPDRDRPGQTRGPGRPAIGPMVNVRMPHELIDRLDAEAERRGLARAAIIRKLLEDGLGG